MKPKLSWKLAGTVGFRLLWKWCLVSVPEKQLRGLKVYCFLQGLVILVNLLWRNSVEVESESSVIPKTTGEHSRLQGFSYFLIAFPFWSTPLPGKAFFQNAPGQNGFTKLPRLVKAQFFAYPPYSSLCTSPQRGGGCGKKANPYTQYATGEAISWWLIFLILFGSVMVYSLFWKYCKWPKTYQQLKSYFGVEITLISSNLDAIKVPRA